ncbi:pyridoxal-phosphate dependent enzyme [Streptomyces sp. SID4946]|uniref:pyridoxal-phosphate dependent enzyme n=1 Tax=Streptomyces TaxID=1883 RepID=UPI00081F09FD|nr:MULTISPECIES: pyridoxal-phosphate dependent enzyme [unclassified Streptomyces]MYQ94952.1 pyridoxal-phosphate dependent enzyme [Streptomyces sp. SID4946]SCF92615.1 cysteine synthase A [Streptomyces sp. DconLS]SCG00022.1 cysteine synthase A [Streptomyces sp. LamerLS-31b]
MLFDTLTDAIGGTPLVRLRLGEARGVEVYAKLELQNLFAMKDRVARNIIREARRLGTLRPDAPVVESSSGTMALGVALVGRSLGHEVHIVTDPRIDPVTLAKLRALGCRVHIVEAMTSHGWQSARLERLAELMAELPGAFWPQQYTNPDNPGAYRELAGELLADLGHIDTVVGAVGSGGSLCGTSRALRESLPGVKVVGVDCVGSALFGQPDVPQRLQSGLGNSLLPKNLDRSLIDEVHWLNDHEAFAATRDLAREQQIFAGNTSGSVYRVLGDLAERAEPGSRIVGIMPDRGDRYADTVYSDEHWDSHRLQELPAPEGPSVIPVGQTALSWSRQPFRAPEELRRHLVFVESNTTGTGMLALELAREELETVPVLLTGDPERYRGLAATGAEVIRCDTNSDAVLRAAVQDRFRREEIAGITTTSDFYVPAAARLARWLGLPGNPAEAVTACRDKSALRALLESAGVHQPRYAVVRDASEVAAAVARTGLPCVVKPADDSGSVNVLLCADEATATAHAERVLAVTTNVRGMPTARTVLVEEYLDAPEYSVEMFTWDGRAECVGITEKSVTGTPHFVEHRHLFPAPLPAETAQRITETVTAALDAAGIRLGATHTEVKLTAEGPAVIEINPRPAGGMIPELIRLATGVDLLEQQLRTAVGLAPALKPAQDAHAGIQFLLPDADGVLDAVDGTQEAAAVPDVEAVTVTASPGTVVRRPRSAGDRIGHVIAGHPTPERVTAALDEARRLLRLSVDTGPRP